MASKVSANAMRRNGKRDGWDMRFAMTVHSGEITGQSEQEARTLSRESSEARDQPRHARLAMLPEMVLKQPRAGLQLRSFGRERQTGASKHSRRKRGLFAQEPSLFPGVLSSYMTSVETPPAAFAPPDGKEGWSIEQAKALYNVDGWGAGYFDVSERGRVIVRPDRDHPERTLDLFDLAKDLQEQGVELPVLLRFSDILRSRIESLSERFASALREFEYDGGYTTVYPIKVNQQRHVVEEIVQFGSAHGVGLECGSKPELQAVLGLTESSEHLIVCNGYKDEEFMRLALMGQKLGHRVFIVVEQLSELDVLLAAAKDLNVQPMAGVRIKLSSEGAGRWAQSGGERSKFGLSAAQVMKLIDRLSAEGRLDLLKLVHFHIGSQVTDIRYIKSALQEIARYYVELRRAGVDIAYLDVGGGLGVDYDGTSSTSHASVNYSLQEYANDVVYTFF